jgi:magnesium chelatase accessory protein
MDRLVFDVDGRDWPNRDSSRFLTAGGMSWHVQIIGSGPPVLLAHGTGASTHSWRRLVPLLTPHFTLIMPDLPGHGFTQTPPSEALTLPGMAAALGHLMEALSIRPLMAIGHSAGAAVLIRMALDGKIVPGAIISINGALRPFQGVTGPLFSSLAKLLFLNPLMPRVFAWRAKDRSTVERLLKGTGSRPDAEDIELYARLFQSPAHCAAALGMMARWDLNTFERDLPKLTARLILIAAANDKAIPPADAAKARAIVQNAQVVEVSGVGHLAHEERPGVIAEIILKAAGGAAAADNHGGD